MISFSERAGFKKRKIDIQKESMDNDLRVRLWNVIYSNLGLNNPNGDLSNNRYEYIIRKIWDSFFKQSLDKMPQRVGSFLSEFKKLYEILVWYEIFDLLEFVSTNFDDFDQELFIYGCNKVLEEEISAYRFIGNKVGLITTDEEIKGIEEAMDLTEEFQLNGARVHIEKAKDFLFDRKKPDYRNSVKESISAVESVCKIITNDSKGDLAKTLRTLEKNNDLHTALKDGFIKLYGYTSDEGGIRHALLDEDRVTFEDAKYMLVTCSAFVSYLIFKSEVNK